MINYSIILLTKNAGSLFPEVLASIFACDGINEAEVIMIDSGSIDLTLRAAAKYRQIRLHQISGEEFGHGRTRNLGAGLARGEILIFLVQDATPVDPTFLKVLSGPLTNPQVAAAYGRQVARSSASPIEHLFLEETYPAFPQSRLYSGSGRLGISSFFFSNVCSAIRRRVWERFPFNENLIMSEDQLWAKEVLQAGYRIVYEPAAAVYHSHNYGLKHIFQRNFDSGFSLIDIAGDSLRQMAAYELGYLLVGVKKLSHRAEKKWIPYFFMHEAFRSLGFFLGKHAARLPASMRRSFSLHKYYWPKRES